MREISKTEMGLLEKHNVIRNTSKGFVNKNGYKIGFYQTRNKRYIEDKYVELSKKLF